MKNILLYAISTLATINCNLNATQFTYTKTHESQRTKEVISCLKEIGTRYFNPSKTYEKPQIKKEMEYRIQQNYSFILNNWDILDEVIKEKKIKRMCIDILFKSAIITNQTSQIIEIFGAKDELYYTIKRYKLYNKLPSILIGMDFYALLYTFLPFIENKLLDEQFISSLKPAILKKQAKENWRNFEQEDISQMVKYNKKYGFFI